MNVVVALVLVTLAADARLADFAYGVRLVAPPQAALAYVELPEDVYSKATRADLADVRVFDAQGREVPHAVWSAPQKQVAPNITPLPLYAIRGHERVDELVLQVRRNTQGALVEVRSAAASGTPVRAFILDASAVAHPLIALELHWTPTPQNFVLSLRIDVSDDLHQWSWVQSDGVVAQLSQGGQELVRRRIELPATARRYVRLSAANDAALPAFVRALAESRPNAAPQTPRLWSELAPQKPKPGVFAFTLAGAMHVDRAQVLFSEPNTVIAASLSSSDARDKPGITRYGGLLYRVQHGALEMTNPELEFAPTAHRHFTLTVESPGGGLGEQEPRLRLGWIQERLLFVPRGPGPFTLAYGNVEAGPSSFAAASLLQLVGDAPVPQAALSDAVALGGDGRLEEPVAPMPWRRAALWSIVGTGVLGIAFMTARTARQLKRTPGPNSES